MRKMMTVNELAGKTGYVMGNDHPRAQRMLREEQMADAKTGPPNFRDVKEGEDSCGSCRDFNSSEMGGRCFRYSVPVSDMKVCDSWTSPEDGEQGESMARRDTAEDNLGISE